MGATTQFVAAARRGCRAPLSLSSCCSPARGTCGYAWNVAVAGDQVYVAAESGGLVILRHAVLQPLYLPLVR